MIKWHHCGIKMCYICAAWIFFNLFVDYLQNYMYKCFIKNYFVMALVRWCHIDVVLCVFGVHFPVIKLWKLMPDIWREKQIMESNSSYGFCKSFRWAETSKKKCDVNMMSFKIRYFRTNCTRTLHVCKVCY